jgi:HlyD family secretion protein
MWKIRILFLILAVGGGAWLWVGRDGGRREVPYRVQRLQHGDIMRTIAATGTIEPEEVIDVGAQVAGQIKFLGDRAKNPSKVIDHGTEVEEGIMLAQIDDAVYKAQVVQNEANLQRAEADLRQMEAKLRQTKREYDRAHKLHPTNAISDLDYDVAVANYETAKATLAMGQAAIAQSKSALDQAKINLGYTVIRSPVKGVIIERRVNVGQTLVANLNTPSLFLIAKDLKRMQIWASVNEADIGSIQPGGPVSFSVDAYPERRFPGTVSQIRLMPQNNQNVVTYTVVVTFDNSSAGLLPYLTANVKFEIDRRANVLKAPNAALRWRPSQIEEVAPEFREEYAAQVKGASAAHDGSARTKADEGAEHATLWVRSGAFVRPVPAQTGLSDGKTTQIKAEGDLGESTEVVTGVDSQASKSEGSNPFMPKLFGGKKTSADK